MLWWVLGLLLLSTAPTHAGMGRCFKVPAGVTQPAPAVAVGANCLIISDNFQGGTGTEVIDKNDTRAAGYDLYAHARFTQMAGCAVAGSGTWAVASPVSAASYTVNSNGFVYTQTSDSSASPPTSSVAQVGTGTNLIGKRFLPSYLIQVTIKNNSAADPGGATGWPVIWADTTNLFDGSSNSTGFWYEIDFLEDFTTYGGWRHTLHEWSCIDGTENQLQQVVTTDTTTAHEYWFSDTSVADGGGTGTISGYKDGTKAITDILYGPSHSCGRTGLGGCSQLDTVPIALMLNSGGSAWFPTIESLYVWTKH